MRQSWIRRCSVRPPARARRCPVHAAETGQTGIVLVDSPPILPRLTEVSSLLLVLKQVRHLSYQSTQSVGRCVGEQGEEGVHELRSCELALVVGRYVFSEHRHLAGIVVEQVGRSFYGSAVADPSRSFLGSHVGQVDGSSSFCESFGSSCGHRGRSRSSSSSAGVLVPPRCGRAAVAS